MTVRLKPRQISLRAEGETEYVHIEFMDGSMLDLSGPLSGLTVVKSEDERGVYLIDCTFNGFKPVRFEKAFPNGLDDAKVIEVEHSIAVENGFVESSTYGDRKRTLDRRFQEDRRRGKERRQTYPGKGKSARTIPL